MAVKLALAFLALTAVIIDAKRIKNNIYLPLQDGGFCFRRTNGTHQTGCTSDLGGNVGVVHLVTRPEDVQWIVENGPHSPYIAMLTPKMFNYETLVSLRKSEKISGVIWLAANNSNPLLEQPKSQSEDSTCPNSGSGIYAQGGCKAWNPRGSNILNEDWPFPIFHVDDAEKTDYLLHDCYEQFNKPNVDGSSQEWPLCAVELSAHMYSVINTDTCVRRNRLVNFISPTPVCDPMGDKNVFYYKLAPSKAAQKGTILLSARMDTVNLIDKAEMGFDSPSTGIVALLAAADIIAKVNVKSNVLFGFFQGESFDYIGSSRMVYDMQRGHFPTEDIIWPKISVDDILGHVELGQLSVHDNRRLYVHADNANYPSDFEAAANKAGLSLTRSSLSRLPPASIQTVLKAKRNLPAAFVSNYDGEFANDYYHSMYDSAPANVDAVVDRIAKVAETLANFVAADTTLVGQSAANESLIRELLECYTVRANCSAFRAVSDTILPTNRQLPDDTPWPQYVGVDRSITFHSMFTHRALALIVAPELPENRLENCSDENEAMLFVKGYSPPTWWNGTSDECRTSPECGHCLNTTMVLLTPAVSPAFVIEDYDLKNDDTYGRWAESLWKVTTSRVFLKASPSLEHGTFALGTLVLLASFVIVIWIDRSDLLPSSADPQPTSI